MEATIAILIWTVILVLVAPVIIACVFLTEPSVVWKISWNGAILRIAQNLFPSTERKMELQLEARYTRMANEVTEFRRQTLESCHAEKLLREKVSLLKTEIADSELKLLVLRTDEPKRDKNVQDRRTTLTELQQKLVQQESHTKDLQERLSVLEADLQHEYTEKQNAIFNWRADSAIKRADAVLEKCSSAYAQANLTRMEQKILEREVQAARVHAESMKKADSVYSKCQPRVLSASSNVKPASKTNLTADLFIDKICTVSRYCALKHSIAKANISDMWRALDPSVDRAFRRLELHHQLAKRSAQLSMQAELEVEKSIAANQNHLKHMTERANSTDENVHRKGYAAERIPSLEESASALSDGLKSIKIRNLSIQQTLFCIEAIVKRLSILKMLISAIPVGKSDIRNQFVDLSNSLSTYLQTCQNKASQSSNESPVNLVEKLHNLEQNALMMYIRIAKGDSTDLNAKAFDRLKSDIATISSALDLERADATSELEKWSGIAALAESDNQQLLLAVARNRTARCSEILKMTEQTLDVLNVTISLTEARTQKTMAS